MDWNIAIGFLLGILASGIAAIAYERVTRPLLEILLDNGQRAQGHYPDRPPHEFYHLNVRNLPAVWPLPGRRPAWSCKATIEAFNTKGERTITEPVYARWTSQPEPLIPAVAGDQSVNIVDFARIISARKVDIHSHEEQQMSVALKYEDQAECYIFSNESYLHRAWVNPAWRLEQGEYRLHVTVFYDRGRATRDFTLKNIGTTRDSLRFEYVTN
jgi:hypothetical protein